MKASLQNETLNTNAVGFCCTFIRSIIITDSHLHGIKTPPRTLQIPPYSMYIRTAWRIRHSTHTKTHTYSFITCLSACRNRAHFVHFIHCFACPTLHKQYMSSQTHNMMALCSDPYGTNGVPRCLCVQESELFVCLFVCIKPCRCHSDARTCIIR